MAKLPPGTVAEFHIRRKADGAFYTGDLAGPMVPKCSKRREAAIILDAQEAAMEMRTFGEPDLYEVRDCEAP